MLLGCIEFGLGLVFGCMSLFDMIRVCLSVCVSLCCSVMSRAKWLNQS